MIFDIFEDPIFGFSLSREGAVGGAAPSYYVLIA